MNNTNTKLLPKFISDKPTDNNFFGTNNTFDVNKKILSNIIRENKLDNKVIALTGKWGSGKSTIINMIKNEDKDIKVVEFDTLSLHNERIKKNFLLNLYDKLEIKELDTKKDTKKDIFKEFNKRTLENYISGNIKYYKKTPNMYIFKTTKILIGIVFLYLASKPLYKIITYIGNKINIFQTHYYEALNYTLSFLLTIIFILLFIKIFDNKKKISINNILKSIFPFINIPSNMQQTLREETQNGDLTNRDFEFYYKYLIDTYYKKSENSNKCIALVIDNLDRIETDKIKNIIYDLYLFISINNSMDKPIFFIALIDKEKFFNLNISNDENEIYKNNSHFFEKIFPIKIEISNISNINWRDFFYNKINEAFDGFNIDKDTIIKSISLYKEFSMSNIIPRDIIYFINKVVFNYRVIEESDIFSSDKNNISIFVDNAFKSSILNACYCMFIEERGYLNKYKDDLQKNRINNTDNELKTSRNNKYYIKEFSTYINKAGNEESVINRLNKLLLQYSNNWEELLFKSYFQTDFPFDILCAEEIETYIYNYDITKINDMKTKFNNIDKALKYFIGRYNSIKSINIWVNVLKIVNYFNMYEDDDLINNLFSKYPYSENISNIIIVNPLCNLYNSSYKDKKFISSKIAEIFIYKDCFLKEKNKPSILNIYNSINDKENFLKEIEEYSENLSNYIKENKP